MFWRRVWSNSGMLARTVATTLSCWAMSRCEAVPGVEPLLDQVEHASCGSEVLARDPQPVLRHQHLEIGGADADDGREHDHFLGKAGGGGCFLRSAPERAVLAPEIDLVACRQQPGTVVSCSPARPRGRDLVALPSKSQRRQQRRTGDLACASAWMMRAIAAPMSRLAVCASSIRLVSSAKWNPRHQSSAGGAPRGVTPSAP